VHKVSVNPSLKIAFTGLQSVSLRTGQLAEVIASYYMLKTSASPS